MECMSFLLHPHIHIIQTIPSFIWLTWSDFKNMRKHLSLLLSFGYDVSQFPQARGRGPSFYHHNPEGGFTQAIFQGTPPIARSLGSPELLGPASRLVPSRLDSPWWYGLQFFPPAPHSQAAQRARPQLALMSRSARHLLSLGQVNLGRGIPI